MDGDTVTPLRTEQVHNVKPAQSLENHFSDIDLPHNPGLGANNWNSGHQDSYCSESVKLTGPTGTKLRLIMQYNPYGFTPIMACNRNNQMIGVAFLGQFRLIVFDSECNILSATVTGHFRPNSFGGGYFYLNRDDNAVVVSNNKLACYPTRHVAKKESVYSLDPIWITSDLVLMITQSPDPFGNVLYGAMPVWKEDSNLYWVMLAGKYDFDTGELTSDAFIAVVEITPDSHKENGCQTRVVDSHRLEKQWNNNTMAVSEQGVFFVTNGLHKDGWLYSIGFDFEKNKIKKNWRTPYQNSGYLKVGQRNIGSGTTPTLFQGEDGTNLVAITDNAYPKMNVVICNRDTGHIIDEVPVFPDMRGCDEASLIGVNGHVVVENNFGHTTSLRYSQYVPNEPGLAMIKVNPTGGSKIIWENTGYPSGFFAMTMLARESGIIFAHTGEWNVADSSTKGGLYSIVAIDSWDGRIIWRIPLGQGKQYCHDYGGIYFNRTNSGTSLFMGTQRFLVSIQEYKDTVLEDDSNE